MNRFASRSTASLAVLAAALAFGPAETAFAAANLSVSDTAVTVDGAEGSGDAAPAAQDSSDHSGLTEIVVTATKRETNLQKTPIAISVLAPEAIKDRHVQSLIDLADGAVPSLRVATFEARHSALTVGIRGIVPFDANQTARDQGVGVYLDGIYLGRQQGLNTALFDAQRIEVLRGPQGTLFGRNTEGGAVSIVTKEPSGNFGGRLIGGVGNYGSYASEAHVDLPTVANIAFKVDGVLQHQDATVKNPLEGQYGWNYHNTAGGRISAKWKPFDGFSATFSYDKAKDENTPNYSQLINYNPNGKVVGQYDPVTLKLVAPGSPAGTSTVCTTCIAPLSPLVQIHTDRQGVAEIGVPQQLSVDRTDGFSSTLKYQVASGVELRSISAWRGVETEQWDNSGGAHRTIFVPNGNFSRYSLSYLRQRQFSQEFQLVGSLPSLDYVVGLYYFNENVREFAATPSTDKWNATGTGYTINSEIVNGAITSGNQGWNDINMWFRQRDSHARARSYAAFAQATWTPVDPVHLTVGGRYTRDKREGALTMVNGTATNWVFTYDRDRFDPMVTLAWDAAQGVNVYAKYSSGFRAGGANDRSSTFGAFGPEAVKAYEVGAKLDLFDRRVRLNLAGYIMDRTGTQIDFDNVDTAPFLADGVTPNPTFNLHTENTANAPGTSKVRGIEAELTVRPIDNLTMGASYAYTYTDVPVTANPNPGPTFGVLTRVFVVYTPENAASGYIDYEIPFTGSDTRVKLHLDANYASSQYSFQAENVKTDASFIVNGRISLANIELGAGNTKLALSAWARNLLDETHIYRRSNANNNTLGAYANFNPPRTFGFEATLNF
ncbi:MAG: TonB-dependent receptor [Sphingomonadales bacterium]|nr:TonB-dependent receptor [Sphingomonadales bacterium]